VTQTTDKELDPEMVCTRVMARLIEDIGCVVIAPDSPAWSDLGEEGPKRSGELRVYRGRGRVQKIVSSCLSLPTSEAHTHRNTGVQTVRTVPRQPGSIDSHSLFVLTHPESPVPHLLLDIARRGERVSVHVDLLPKRDLAVSQDYLERCYEPLSAVRAQVDLETSRTGPACCAATRASSASAQSSPRVTCGSVVCCSRAPWIPTGICSTRPSAAPAWTAFWLRSPTESLRGSVLFCATLFRVGWWPGGT
jgi:hypothetical protein